jgi:hypothetical protein
MVMAIHPPILIGANYGRLTVVQKAPSRGEHTYWVVKRGWFYRDQTYLSNTMEGQCLT